LEAEIGRTAVWGQPRQIVHKNPISKIEQNGLDLWPKQVSVCFATVKSWVQMPVTQKKNWPYFHFNSHSEQDLKGEFGRMKPSETIIYIRIQNNKNTEEEIHLKNRRKEKEKLGAELCSPVCRRWRCSLILHCLHVPGRSWYNKLKLGKRVKNIMNRRGFGCMLKFL
jgi:hypothetical protein